MKLKLRPKTVQRLATPAMRLLAASWRIQTVHEERWRALHATGRP